MRHDPRLAASLRDQAVKALQAGKAQHAEHLLRQILRRKADFETLTLLGVSLRRQGRSDEALAAYDGALELNPRSANTHANRANLLNALGRSTDALRSADAALAIAPSLTARTARGAALSASGRLRDALDEHARAMAEYPTAVEPIFNHAKTLQSLGDVAGALEGYDRVLALQPNAALALAGRGHALVLLRRWPEAIEAYDRAFELDPNQPQLAGHRLMARLQICEWATFDAAITDLSQRIDSGAPAAAPFALVATPLSAQQQLRCATAHTARLFAAPPAPPSAWPGNDRIRLGYFSADYREHATAHLLAELIELHDRSQFEVIGFAFGPPADGPMRRRLDRAFDRMIDVGRLDDAVVAQMARDLGIDIALDLKGYTHGSRPGVFAQRAAPIQVSYLGFPMTMGAAFIDYLIADPEIVPDAARPFYAEKIARLPGCYQPNDRQRQIGETPTSRADHGLPDEALVFASFNGSYKISPDAFAVWMRLLTATPDAVLWLLQDNDWAPQNLRRAALAANVDPARLIFAPFAPLPQHLERLGHADLFLDTFACSAHTTASDALWASLPLVTLRGRTFARRVAASLLTQVGLSELIAETPLAYEALALDLARDRARLRALRAYLATEKLRTPLFDTPRYTQDLEALYRLMHQRRLDGLAPAHLG